MRIVCDTNVLVSGMMLSSGFPGRIVDLIRAGRVQTVVDDRILAEYAAVLRRPYFRRYFTSIQVEHVLEFLHRASHRVVCDVVVRDLPDPADLPFLETALSAQVPLVTGNIKHFPEPQARGHTILTPRDFIVQIT